MRIALTEPLSDGRVTLRWMHAGDVAAQAAAYRDDPELGRMLGGERDPDEDEIRARMGRQGERAEGGRGLELAVADPAGDAFWGAVILHSFDWHSRRAEVGFWLIPAVRRQGVATAAVSLILDHAFGALDLLRMEMTTIPDNPAVPALARRLGFTREGVLRARNIERGRRVDIIWFGLLREEWTARPPAAAE